jgi:hypothetical protein
MSGGGDVFSRARCRIAGAQQRGRAREQIDRELARLERMTLDELRAEWARRFQVDPPPGHRRELLPGFTDADLSIEAKESTLTIRGQKQTNDEEKAGLLYRGIAARNFERSFQLADYVEVKGASLENGLLHVDLAREIPEAMKPRAIPIAGSRKILEVKPTQVAA